MPRFGTKSLLVGFAVVAVWFSTFTGYALASDVRKGILLLIVVASGSFAIYSRGWRRAFWSAFFLVMCLCGGLNLNQPLHRYLPDFAWLDSTDQSSPSFVSPYFLPAAPGPTPAPSNGPQPPLPAPPAMPPVVYTPVLPMPVPGTSAREARSDSYVAAWTLGLSVIAGFVAAYIYAQLRKSPAEST